MAEKKVTWKLTAEDDTGSAFRSLKANLDGVQSAVGRLTGAMATLAGGGLAISFAAASKAAEESEAATRRLEAVMRATGNTSGFTASQIGVLADNLARVTQFDDEGFKNATASILRFGEISGRQLERLLKLSADYAAFTNGDLVASAETLGKAITAPTQGIDRLQRAVGYLTDAQKQNIKAMEEGGDKIGAQAALLDILEKKIGGTAAAMNQGLTRATNDLKKAISELLELAGKKGDDSLTVKAMDTLSSQLRGMKQLMEEGDWVQRLMVLLATSTGNPMALGSIVRGIADADVRSGNKPLPQGDASAEAMIQYNAMAEAERRTAESHTAAMTKLWKERLEAQKRASEEFAKNEKRLRDEDAKGWVAHAEAVFKEADETNTALAQISEDYWKNEEKLRDEDIKGWVAHAEAVLQAADEENLALAKIAEDRSKRETDQWKGFLSGVDSGSRDVWNAFVDGGANAGKVLRETLKRTFFDWIYQQFAKPIVMNIIMALAESLGVTGLATAAAQQVGTSTVGAGVGEAVGGAAIGKQIWSWMSQNMALLTYVAIIVAAAVIADQQFKNGWRIDGNRSSAGLGGVFDTGTSGVPGAMWMATRMDRTYRALGFNDEWAAILSGSSVASRIFGRRARQNDAYGVVGDVTGGTVTGQNWQDWSEQGGWFSSTRRGTDFAAFNAEQSTFFSDIMARVGSIIGAVGALVGVDASAAVSGFSRSFNFQLNENGDPLTADQINTMFNDFFGSVLQEQLALVFDSAGNTRLAQYVRDLQGTGAEVTAQIEELVNVMQGLANLNINGLDVEALMEFQRAGETLGDTFTRVANTWSWFQENFTTDAEKLERAQQRVNDTFGALGIAVPTNITAFRQLVESLDLSTEAGRAMFTTLMGVAPSFLFVANAAGNAADAVDEAAAALERQADIQRQIAEDVRSSRQMRLDQIIDARSGIRGFLDSTLLDQNVTALDPMQRLNEARRQYEEQLGLAQGGDLGAAGRLGGVARTYLDIARELFASSSQYVDIFRAVTGAVQGVDDRLAIDQRQLEATLGLGATMAQVLEVLIQIRDGGTAGDQAVARATEAAALATVKR